jgi:cell division protease FtsH
MERVIAGPERKGRVMNDETRKTIAYHESGHALVGHTLEHADPVHKISIISRGRALGYTMSLPEEDKFLETRRGMLDSIVVLLGGRTAEELFCDDITTGASNDLERATKLARHMVTRYGMSEELGTQVFGEAEHQVFLGRDYANRQDLSAETAKRIDDEVERIMREAHDRAREILAAHRDRMDQMAEVLLARETIEGEAMMALLDGKWDEYLAEHPEAAEPAKAAEPAAPSAPSAAEQARIDEQLEAEAYAAAAAAMREEAGLPDAQPSFQPMAEPPAQPAAEPAADQVAQPAEQPVITDEETTANATSEDNDQTGA